MVTQFPRRPEHPHGGVEAVSVNLVAALARSAALELHVVTLDASCQARESAAWQGATIHRLPRPEGSMLRVAVGPGKRLIQRFVGSLDPDLVHAHDTYGIMVQGLDRPRVFTVHGFIYGDTLLSQSRFAWLRAQCWRWVETRAWADQPNIISISPYVRERVSRSSEAVIRDIDNPIDARFFERPSALQPGRIFSAAVISRRKNTLLLVGAFRKLLDAGLDVHLRLAGAVVEPGYGAQLERFIEREGLHDRVQLLGVLSSAAVLEELRLAATFALVSLEENSPMGIEEAMAASVPVVSSNRCGMPYMIEHGGSTK